MPKKGRLPEIVSVPSQYALVAGLLGFGLLIALYYMGRHPFLIPVFFDFRVLLFLVFIFFSLKELRDLKFQGILYFWQGMIGSLVFTLIFAVLSSLLLMIFMYWNDEFLTTYIHLMEQQLLGLPTQVVERIGKETYEANLKSLPETRSMDLTILYLWQSFIISFFISIILSVVLRRQPKNQ